MTPSSSAWTPLFLNAEPQKTRNYDQKIVAAHND
jgi:hypothetical protein